MDPNTLDRLSTQQSNGLYAVNFAAEKTEKAKAKLVAALQMARSIWQDAFGGEVTDVDFDVTMSPSFNTILQRVIEQDIAG